MKYKKEIITLFLIVLVYIVLQSLNYNLEYNLKEKQEQVEMKKGQLDEANIKEDLQLSREQAINEDKLQLNENIYYLEDQDE